MSRPGLALGCAILATIIFFVPKLTAQTSATGALTGTVTDPTGAVMANVNVTATNTGTGQTRTVTTGADGTYKLALLPPGNYRVQFQATGFNEVVIPSGTVNVTETTVMDGHLTVGAQTQEITVQGEAVAVQTTDATVGTLLAGKNIADLPLNSRNYTNLLGLSAGASAAVYNAANLGKGNQDISVNGGASSQNNYQMDGVSLEDPASSGSTADLGFGAGIGIVNPDAIQEFKIQTSLFDAGYGRKPGANVNVVTKSGTNEFHGAAFEFFRNTVLNANDFFRNQSPPVNGVPNNSRQVLNQNQYGGVIGGPIKKDKLFFFTSYQETWQKNGVAPQGYSTPTLPPVPNGDRTTAAFQTALGAEFCPATFGGLSGTAPVYGSAGVQVACNGSNINPVALNLLRLKNPDGSYYIPSSGTTGYVPTTFSVPANYRDHQALANVDYAANAKNTLAFKWFYDLEPTVSPFGCSATSSAGGAPSTCLPDTAGQVFYSQQTGMVKWTSIVTNNVVNEARISFLRNTSHLTAPIPFTDTQVGIAPITPSINYLDQIIISQNGFTIGTNFVLGGSYKNSTAAIIGEQLSWNHGKHTLRFGGEYSDGIVNSGLPGDSVAALTFQTFQDFLLGLPGCPPGNGACTSSTPLPGTNGSTLSNIANSGNFSTLGGPKGPAFVNFLQKNFNVFAQDDFKLKPGFTLNLGLRWEYDGLVTSRSGELGNVWPSLVNTVPIPGSTPATGTLAGFVVPNNYQPAANPVPPVGGLFVNNLPYGTRNSTPMHNFSPRVGFAWQPTSSDKFVVRGGFGYFYEQLTQANAATTYFIGQPNDVLIGRAGAANVNSSFAQPLPATTFAWQDRWVNFATNSTSNLAQYTQQEIYLTPLVYEWNLNVQYEFLPTWVVELGYVGSHGIHLTNSSQEVNQAQLVGNPLGNNNGTPAPGIAAQLIQGCNYSTLVGCNNVANAALRVPFLGFAPGGLIEGSTDGDDKFNSLQVTVRKRLSHGLTVQAAYTWAKSLATALTTNDATTHAAQYGPNTAYHPQRLAINYSWDLPIPHADGLTGKLTNGWALSGVTIIQDGTPLSVTDSRGGTVYGFGSAGETSTAQFCSGGTASSAQAGGSVKSRLHSSTSVTGINGVGGYFNTADFNTTCKTIVAPGSTDGATEYGNSPIGVTLGPGQFNWDMSLTKTTVVGGIHEGATLQFRSEFFNTFNHAQFNAPVTNVAAGNFGSITSTSVNPRLIQFALKYIF